MNKIIQLLLASAMTLSACAGIKKTVIASYMHEMYIDYKYISFQGRNSTQTLYFAIDSTNGFRYDGKLVINGKDTLVLRGFEKGGHYITTYRWPAQQLSGSLDIWCTGEDGQIRDSLTISDRNQANKIIKEETLLYRRPR